MMIERLSRVGLAALLGALGIAAPASAQQPPASDYESRSIPGWTFTPGITIGTLFDSNVAIAGPDVNGDTASDNLLQMEPFGLLGYHSPRTTFAGGYRGSLRRYFDLSGLNGADHRAYVNWRERLTRRISLFADQDYEQVASTDRLQLNDLPFQRLSARHNAVTAGVEARVTKSVDAAVRYENGWVQFEQRTPGDVRTGGMVHGIRSDLSRRLTDRLSLGGTYDFRHSDLNEGTRQQTFQETGGLVRYRVGEQTSVEAAAGVSHLVEPSRDISQTGSFLRGSVMHRTARAVVGGEYSRGYKPSFGFGGATKSDDVSGYVTMPLVKNRAYVQESASWHRALPVDPLDHERRSTWLNTVVGYSLQRWLRLEGYWAYSRQDTRLPGGLVERHLIGAQVVISEPMRIR
jgi:hypothetical protein